MPGETVYLGQEPVKIARPGRFYFVRVFVRPEFVPNKYIDRTVRLHTAGEKPQQERKKGHNTHLCQAISFLYLTRWGWVSPPCAFFHSSYSLYEPS